ncbi:MAG: GNAT family N-acetyltransferase [Sandaracinaceae bacterium]|nr:GNAT family N-acetyltransferase [Sandaracinaceae bacterium]
MNKRKKATSASSAGSVNSSSKKKKKSQAADGHHVEITVRRMHRRDINRVWEFLKRTFRDVNRETVEYQRPHSKERFAEIYDDEGVEQLIFEIGGEIVGYAQCSYEVSGSDNWVNPRYFESRNMRPLFVEELATHPDYQGIGVGSFMLEQLEHLARIHGCTHLVLEVAENNERALGFYRKRGFTKLDAAIFMAKRIEREPELLPPRKLRAPFLKTKEAKPQPKEEAAHPLEPQLQSHEVTPSGES